MKIALVASEIHDRTGMARGMANLARWLRTQGETVHLYTAEIHCPLSNEGFTWTRIPAAETPRLLRLWQFYQQARRLIPKNTYEIIHACGEIIPQQTVTTLYACQPTRGESLPSHPIKIPTLAKDLRARRLAAAMATRLERQAVRRSKRVICASRRVAEDVYRIYHPAQLPEVICPGVSLSEFKPQYDASQREGFRQARGASPDECVLLFVGEYTGKGLDILLQALQTLQNRKIRLWIVGRDPQEVVFRQQVADAHLTAQVTFLGFRMDVHALMQAADLFVLPAREASYGTVVSEAMASGLPVITSRLLGAAELIASGDNGILLNNPEDAQELAGALGTLVADASHRQKLGAAALRTLSKHSWDAMSAEVYRQYCQLISTPRCKVVSDAS